MNFGRNRIGEQKKSKKFIFIFLIIFIVIAFFLISKYNNYPDDTKITQTREITIEKGDSFSNLGNKIDEFDNIFYKFYIRNNQPDFQLAEGKYKITEGEDIFEVWKSLQKPILKSENITVLEGWNIYDIDRKLTNDGLISEGEYISYVKSSEKIEKLKEFFPFLRMNNLESLEGFLYPDTYKINPNEFGVNILVIAQLEEFEKKVYEQLFKDKYDNKTIYEVINLASIVEKEEHITKNKSTVAGILKKRLNNGWQIGADATVCYPFGLPTQECTPKKVLEYLYEDNGYNTRRMKGLPKTPIGNPSFETIEATLNDTKTEYWYYLHNLSGKIFYAKNEAEHEFNKKNYMNKR